MNPFDFAWMLLKQETVDPYRHFLPEKQRFRTEQELAEVGGDGPVDAPTPDMEEPAAMAPDKPPTGMSEEEKLMQMGPAGQKLQALLEEHPELRERMGGQ